MLSNRLWVILAVPLVVMGCKRAPASAATSSPTNSAETAAAAPGLPASVEAAPSAPAPPSVEPVNLDRELRKWIVRNQRPPKNFEDFAATAGIQIPPPPPGKKYVIDKTMHVVLANR